MALLILLLNNYLTQNLLIDPDLDHVIKQHQTTQEHPQKQITYPTQNMIIDPALQHFINQCQTTQESPQKQITSPSYNHISTLGYNQSFFQNLSDMFVAKDIISTLEYNLLYNLFVFLSRLDKALDNQEFKKKFFEIHENITLPKTEESNTSYKLLFMLLKKFPNFAKQQKEIEEFQQLFENTSLKNKNELFSFWCTLTFPNFPVNDFLKDSIKLTKEKVKKSKDFRLQQKLLFVFPKETPDINYNTTLILVKVWEYLETRDTATQQRLFLKIANICSKAPIFTYKKHQKIPLSRLPIDEHNNIVLIFYQIPKTEHIVALTEKSSLSSQSIRESIQKDYKGHIYFGSHNLACIVFQKFKIEPPITFLTDQDIDLMDIQGGIMLTNESIFKTQLFYSQNMKGGIYFWDEEIGHFLHLSEIIKNNQKVFEKIEYDFKLKINI